MNEMKILGVLMKQNLIARLINAPPPASPYAYASFLIVNSCSNEFLEFENCNRFVNIINLKVSISE